MIYTYKVSVLPEKILEERLSVQNSNTAYDVFTRVDGQPIKYDEDYLKKEQIEFLNFIAKATRSNQLFLTNAVQLNMEALRPLYEWFETQLTVIAPNSEFASIQRYASLDDLLSEESTQLIRMLGTSIDHLVIQKQSGSNQDFCSAIPKEWLDVVQQSIRHTNDVLRIKDFLVRKENDELFFEKLFTVHKNRDGEDIVFLRKT